MENVRINANEELTKLVNITDKEKLNSKLMEFSEQDTNLCRVLNRLIDCGFITTSCSKGHDNEKWKDAFYVAMYLDCVNVKKVLNFIYKLNKLLTNDELKLVNYTFNYNSVLKNNAYDVEFMFGLQIDVYGDCELKSSLCEKICLASGDDLSSNEIPLDYNFIYLVNRFVNYSKFETSWINISVNANELDKMFTLVYKKSASDKRVVNKTYCFRDGLEEFEYIMNY